MSEEDKKEYYMRQQYTDDSGRIVMVSLLLRELPRSVPERTFTFKKYVSGKQTALLSFLRWKDFKREGEGFRYFHTYAFDVVIKQPSKRVGVSITIHDYEMTGGIRWFDESIEKVIETIKERGLETVMNEVFEDVKTFVFSRFSRIAEDLE
ncbi:MULTISPECIES: hypothetical protein [Thermoprotei]|uniref:hypothetical protein n=1 Tax=Thermoprotei TaxID=183924 RepID=UPI003165AA62